MTESLRSSSLIYLSDNMIGIYTIYRFYAVPTGQGETLGCSWRFVGAYAVPKGQGGSLGAISDFHEGWGGKGETFSLPICIVKRPAWI